jgi:hypothetical protein
MCVDRWSLCVPGRTRGPQDQAGQAGNGEDQSEARERQAGSQGEHREETKSLRFNDLDV